MITSDQALPQVHADRSGTLIVSGELDLASAPRLGAALEARIGSGQRDIVLDLSAIEFCDLSRLSVLVNANRALRATGHRLVVRNPSPHVGNLLAATKLDQVLEMG